MKKAFLILASAMMLAGCYYTTPAVAHGDKIVLPKNTGFFGLMRAVYVCQVSDGGLTNCQSSDAP